MKRSLFIIFIVFVANLNIHAGLIGEKPEAQTKNGDALFLFNKGIQAQMSRNYEGAIKFYKQAVLHDSNFTDAIDNIASSFNRLNKPDSAVFYYVKSLSIKPNNIIALNNLANIYSITNQIDKSADTYKTIIKIDTLSADGYMGLADVNLRQKDYSAATKNAKDAYRILEKRNKQEAGKAMLFLGIAQLSLGNKPEAKLAFEKARQLGTKVSYDYMRQCSK